METVKIIFACTLIGLIIVPICFNVFKQKIWDFIKEELEKDAKYRKMVNDMLKGKK